MSSRKKREVKIIGENEMNMLRRAGVALGCLVALATCLEGQRASGRSDFTIEDVMSAPFSSTLVAAPKGNNVAWVSNERGVRNVLVADVSNAAAKARRITQYSADDGSDMGELAWEASGRAVLYTRGGSLEGGGPVNTLSLASGAAKQEVWEASIEGGEPKRIGEGHTPLTSPDGTVVVYIKDNQIWSASLSGEPKPAQLIHDRGRSASLTWSHDGKQIAFVSQRGDHALVGVFDLGQKSVRWLAPSVDSDRAPVWSPDDKQVAFIRTLQSGQNLSSSREGQPWSIWVADASSGEGRKIWSATAGAGSVFHPLLSGTQLFWTSNDWLVFPWEKTGWQRLYAVRSSGGEAKLLTPGNSEIFNVALHPSGARLVYSSNEGDSDRLHLWEVDLTGRAPRQLTKGDGIEDLPAITGAGRVVALHSDAQFPIRPASLSDGGTLVDLARDLIPSSFPGSKLIVPVAVSISSPDGMKVPGQLFVPRQRSGDKRPAILFFHGGPRRQMYLGWHPMDSYAYLYAMNQFLVNDGYVVLSVNFRGGIGYGLDFREAKDFGMGGASEFNDILGAIQFLKSRADVDPKRIGIYGGSYGGFMTALALARASDQVAAGVDYAGVHDWKAFAAVQLPRTDQRTLDKAFESSPVATLDKWTSPVLIIQADDDRNVPFSQMVELITGLRKIGKAEIEQIVIPDEIHDLLRHRSWLTFFNATREFFDRKLANQN